MDLTIYKNKAAKLPVSFVSDSVAVDLTGWTIAFMAKKKASDADSAAVITATLGNTVPTTGVATLTLTATQTNIDAGIYPYDIQAFPVTAGEETLIITGFLTVVTPVRDGNP